jgi:hypothetical protein
MGRTGTTGFPRFYPAGPPSVLLTRGVSGGFANTYIPASNRLHGHTGSQFKQYKGPSVLRSSRMPRRFPQGEDGDAVVSSTLERPAAPSLPERAGL